MAVEKIQLFSIMIQKDTDIRTVERPDKGPPYAVERSNLDPMSESRLGAEQRIHKTQQVYKSL